MRLNKSVICRAAFFLHKMKTNSKSSETQKPGVTLLELTVVILVLLSLISILFVGARAWKKGADRSANLLNIRNTQQAMRGHQNLNQLEPGAVFALANLVTYMRFPVSVAGGNANGGVDYAAGGLVTPQSATPATTVAHIWIVPSALGLPTAAYGHTAFNDITGW